MSACLMVYAEMQTEHYTFRAIASYRPEAIAAIKRGWEEHMKQMSRTSDDLQMITSEKLEDHYGINTFIMDINNCLRDDVTLNVR